MEQVERLRGFVRSVAFIEAKISLVVKKLASDGFTGT